MNVIIGNFPIKSDTLLVGGYSNNHDNPDLKDSIIHLNNARLGSFGEYIFEQVEIKLGSNSKKKHKSRVDFIVNGKSVDVKTTRRHISEDLGNMKTYVGKRVDGVFYVLVEFFNNKVRVSNEGNETSTIDWNWVSELWETWEGNKEKRKRTKPDNAENERFRNIQKEITDFFQLLHIVTRIIYRTCQKDFGNESPANLKPSQGKMPDGLTIFIDFKDMNIARDNIRRIICFPNYRAGELPMKRKIHLHKAKVDLEQLPSQFKFNDIDELKTNYDKCRKPLI